MDVVQCAHRVDQVETTDNNQRALPQRLRFHTPKNPYDVLPRSTEIEGFASDLRGLPTENDVF
jgi:hypothetical protein